METEVKIKDGQGDLIYIDMYYKPTNRPSSRNRWIMTEQTFAQLKKAIKEFEEAGF